MSESSIYSYLSEHGISFARYDHPPVFTVVESHEIMRDIPGQGTKNLFLTDPQHKQFFLITVSEHKRVDLKSLAKKFNVKKFSFGSAEYLKEFLGVTPGSVTPLALINDKELRVQIVIDEDLILAEQIQCHPLRNDATVVLKPADLLRFFKILNREYMVVRL